MITTADAHREADEFLERIHADDGSPLSKIIRDSFAIGYLSGGMAAADETIKILTDTLANGAL